MSSLKEQEKQCDREAPYSCELEEDLDALRQVDAFSGVPLERLKLYAYLSKRVSFQPGDFVFRQGETVDRCYVIISGRAECYREYPDHFLKLKELQPYELLGGLAFLADVQHLFSVRAVSQLDCLALDRESFLKVIQQFPDITIKIIQVMFKRAVQLVEKTLEHRSHECIHRDL